MKKYAIIVAAGSGIRMASQIPKQFLLLKNMPILMHTLNRYYTTVSDIDIYVVLSENHLELWNKLKKDHNFYIPHQIIIGGKERFHSVKNALQNILPAEDDALIAVHDAVRPLTSAHIIQNSFRVAEKYGSAVPAVSLKDSIRKIVAGKSEAVNRNEFVIVQTPQTFLFSILKKSYSTEWDENFTDDASVVERAGYTIKLIEGDYNNIKITTPEDLMLAEIIMNK